MYILRVKKCACCCDQMIVKQMHERMWQMNHDKDKVRCDVSFVESLDSTVSYPERSFLLFMMGSQGKLQMVASKIGTKGASSFLESQQTSSEIPSITFPLAPLCHCTHRPCPGDALPPLPCGWRPPLSTLRSNVLSSPGSRTCFCFTQRSFLGHPLHACRGALEEMRTVNDLGRLQPDTG